MRYTRDTMWVPRGRIDCHSRRAMSVLPPSPHTKLAHPSASPAPLTRLRGADAGQGAWGTISPWCWRVPASTPGLASCHAGSNGPPVAVPAYLTSCLMGWTICQGAVRLVLPQQEARCHNPRKDRIGVVWHTFCLYMAISQSEPPPCPKRRPCWRERVLPWERS
jgi:hypothetical protein